jgi:ABC-2 type transport system ATP-binding protein
MFKSPVIQTPSRDESGALAIEVRGLVRRFGERAAVAGLDLTVARGESLGLLGPNGAGKTTTIRILSTLIRATAGEVRVLGFDPARDAVAIRRRIGVVPQEIALYDELTARENLDFFAQLQLVPRERRAERVARALDAAGLADRAADRVVTFSGGMKRRLNLVAALLHEPELVFLDEPTVGIDPQSRNRVFALVEELRRGGTTLVYTTHQLGEVERLCDRIVVLDAGRKLAEGTLRELQATVRAAGTERIHVEGARASDAARVLAERGITARVEEVLPSLEEVFLELTGRALRDDES